MGLRYTSHKTLAAAGVLPFLILAGCGGSGGGGNSAQPLTTRQQTIRPVAVAPGTPQILPRDAAHYATYGYSAYQKGAGADEGRKLTIMPSGYAGSPNAARLLTYFSISDPHITDKESPAQMPIIGWSAPYLAGPLYASAYTPTILSTTQVLDAAVKTINAVNRQTPLDFGICLGDVANSSQYNELRWFIDVMDGKYITPSSGADAGADTIDYQKPFQAAGLDRSIPWYEAIGNHDQAFMGGAYPTDKVKAAEVGTGVLNMSPNVVAANATEGTGLYVGVVDGTTPYGDVIKGGLASSFATPPTVVADANRLSVTTDISSPTKYVSEFFNTTTLPSGHGFARANSGSLAACYTFTPKANMPIKVIVLDDTCKTNNPAAFATGSLDATRFAWLTTELQKGQDAGQLMIVACHIPISPQKDLFDSGPSPQWYSGSTPSEPDVMAALHKYPNLILLMAGHRHNNTVTPQPSPDPAHPEYGFWEVETPSLRDFPRNFRTFDILRNNDNSISIVTTDVDPVVAPGSVAEKSLGYAIASLRLLGCYTMSDTSPHVYNAELVKLLTPAMQKKIAGYGTALGWRAAKQ